MSKIILVYNRHFVRKKLLIECGIGCRKIDEDYLLSLDDINFASILVQLCPYTETSKYSLTLRNNVNKKDNQNTLLKLTEEERFPELFDNPELTDGEYNYVYSNFQKEKVIMLNLLHDDNTNLTTSFNSNLLLPCEQNSTNNGKQSEDKNLYCYLRSLVCGNNRNCEIIYVYEDGEIFCFEKFTLLTNLAKGITVNPITGYYFDKLELEKLYSNYSLEIKLLRRGLK